MKLSRNPLWITPARAGVFGCLLAVSPITSAAVVEATLFGQIPDTTFWEERSIAGLFVVGSFRYNTQTGAPQDLVRFNTTLFDLGFFIGPSLTDFSEAAFFSSGPATVGNLAVDRREAAFRVDDVELISGSFPFPYFGFVYNNRFAEQLAGFPGDPEIGQPFTPSILDAATEELLSLQATDADGLITSDFGIVSVRTQPGSGGAASIFPSIYSLEIIAVPEPSSAGLLILAALGSLGLRCRSM